MLQSSADQTISALRELGVGVQVDDFGTGYSSLASLHHFDLTALKIDRRFVDNLDNLGRAPASHSVVQAILALAEALKLGIIAEGVETEQQRRSLLALGCAVGQGFLFARAVSPAEATRLWRQGFGRSALRERPLGIEPEPAKPENGTPPSGPGSISSRPQSSGLPTALGARLRPVKISASTVIRYGRA